MESSRSAADNSNHLILFTRTNIYLNNDNNDNIDSIYTLHYARQSRLGPQTRLGPGASQDHVAINSLCLIGKQ